jgi:hypothetical protein
MNLSMMDEISDLLSSSDSADRRLLLGGSGCHIVLPISSHAMALASPVWKKILHPPFSQLPPGEDGSAGSQDKYPDFSEDDVEALLLLLRIAHLQFDKVPPELTLEGLLNVAILCDKYICTGLVEPWLPQWLANEETESKEPDCGEWLYIAWIFRREKIFKELATKLIYEVTTNDEGKCLTSSGEDFLSPMPPDIIG